MCFAVGNWKIIWKILLQQREEGEGMPSYEYRCPKCNKNFTVILSIGEHDAGKVKCPKCGDRKVEQLITAFQVKTSRKS
jgi:putative FmdB family regulatory protein